MAQGGQTRLHGSVGLSLSSLLNLEVSQLFKILWVSLFTRSKYKAAIVPFTWEAIPEFWNPLLNTVKTGI